MGFQLLANVRVGLPKGRLSSLGHGSSSSVAQGGADGLVS